MKSKSNSNAKDTTTNNATMVGGKQTDTKIGKTKGNVHDDNEFEFEDFGRISSGSNKANKDKKHQQSKPGKDNKRHQVVLEDDRDGEDCVYDHDDDQGNVASTAAVEKLQESCKHHEIKYAANKSNHSKSAVAAKKPSDKDTTNIKKR